MTTIETIRNITVTAKIANKIEQETKAELARLKLEKATIEFCENYVESEILNAATEGIGCVYLPTLGREPYHHTDEWRFLKVDTYRYANGDTSYVPDYSKPKISIAYLTNYLERRGFTVTVETSYYMQYSWGQQKGRRIRISW